VLLFLALLALFTGLVQWNGLANFLNGITGFQWSEGLVGFFKENTEELIMLFVVTIFFEFIGLERSLEAERQRERAVTELLDASLAASPNTALLEYVLTREHGREAAISLSRYLVRDESVLKEFSVSIRVAPAPEGFQVTFVLRYKAVLPRYLVAVTDTALDTEPLTLARLVTETFVVPPGQVSAPNSPMVATGRSRNSSLGSSRRATSPRTRTRKCEARSPVLNSTWSAGWIWR
jgi:hypothetical protein